MITAPDDRFVRFYEGKGTLYIDTQFEVALEDIWKFSQKEKENNLNYIKWMFPTDQTSPGYPTGPTLTRRQFEVLSNNATVVGNVFISFTKMLDFYGLQYNEEKESVEKSTTFSNEATWLRAFDHNHMRISRILRSLVLFGKVKEAKAFYQFLATLDKSTEIRRSTIEVWQNNLRVSK